MTLTDLQKLTPEQKRVKCATLNGYTVEKIKEGPAKDLFALFKNGNQVSPAKFFEKFCWLMAPDYPNDINAMAGVVKTLSPDLIGKYEENLYAVTHKGIPTEEALFWSQHHYFLVSEATAAQRQDAYLLTVG